MGCPKYTALLSLLPNLKSSIDKLHAHFWHYSNIIFKGIFFVCFVYSRDVLLYIFCSSVTYL